MATDYARRPLGSAELLISDLPDAGRFQMCDPATPFVRQSSNTEAHMLLEIDAIQERLRVGVPQLTQEMAALFARIRDQGMP